MHALGSVGIEVENDSVRRKVYLHFKIDVVSVELMIGWLV
jgi:hypothetical protein